MKSQLPESHRPAKKTKDSIEQCSLAKKLSAIKTDDITEEKKIKEPITFEFSQPKFLDIDIPEDSLEELARIDAELENDDHQDFVFEDNSLFVRF